MPAYLIAFIEVTNPTQYAQYTQRTPAAIAAFGGRFIVRGGPVTTLEGPQENRRVVVIEFPNREQANAFYKSDVYQQAKQFRVGAANGTFIIVEGVEGKK